MSSRSDPRCINHYSSHLMSLCLTWLNLIALIVAEPGILSRAVGIASGGSCASVTCANLPAVFIICVALTPEVCGHLESSATDLHCRSIYVGHMLRGESPALIESTFTSSITKHWLVLDVNLLVDVKLCIGCKRREEQQEGAELHFWERCLNKKENFEAQML